MGTKDTEYIENGIPFRNVPLVDGSFRSIETGALVGICHYYLHKGYLSVALLNAHDCINKECPFLEKLENYPYWVRRRNKEAKELIRKEKLRLAQQKEAYMQKKLEHLRSTAQQIADECDFKIHITRVAVRREVHETKYRMYYEYIVNFTSESRINDNMQYFPLALQMRRRFGGKYFLRHVRDVDGSYVTTEEWERFSITKSS